MKKNSLILLFLTYATTFNFITAQMIGKIQEQVFETPYRYNVQNVNYFVDQALYVNGGLIFNYPTNWFLTAPTTNVSLSVNPLVPFSTTSSYSAIVETNTNTSITVRVLLTTSSMVTEANSGDVFVTINACGEPG